MRECSISKCEWNSCALGIEHQVTHVRIPRQRESCQESQLKKRHQNYHTGAPWSLQVSNDGTGGSPGLCMIQMQNPGGINKNVG
jgi:hypothetical protein